MFPLQHASNREAQKAVSGALQVGRLPCTCRPSQVPSPAPHMAPPPAPPGVMPEQSQEKFLSMAECDSKSKTVIHQEVLGVMLGEALYNTHFAKAGGSLSPRSPHSLLEVSLFLFYFLNETMDCLFARAAQ